MARRNEGKETWHRLLEWERGQTPAERLAAILLNYELFTFKSYISSYIS